MMPCIVCKFRWTDRIVCPDCEAAAPYLAILVLVGVAVAAIGHFLTY